MSVSSLFNLHGSVALVTGAARGIGGAAAEVLAEAGADILLLGRNITTLQQQATNLARFGGRVHPIACDVGNAADVHNAANQALAAFGHVDILVNNAGIIRRAPAADYSLADWQAVMDTNLTGAFLLSQRIGSTMVERGSGKIINIASLLSFSGGMNVVAYTASKSALAGITRSFANEWGRHGVNVNAIAPGYIRTEATAALQRDPERYQSLLSRIPAGRWGEPSDLKGPILFLASNASNYVNGHILTVDGGWMAA
ncbi:MAG: SDR family oxidoreductase [Chlorobi bacterium CHB2]|nr:SDR family oxidoreductase [Chlorobi bacterium CHB2]